MGIEIEILPPPSEDLIDGELDIFTKHEDALRDKLIQITGRTYSRYRWVRKESVTTQRYFSLKIVDTGRILYETGIKNLESMSPDELVTKIDYEETFRGGEKEKNR